MGELKRVEKLRCYICEKIGNSFRYVIRYDRKNNKGYSFCEDCFDHLIQFVADEDLGDFVKNNSRYKIE